MGFKTLTIILLVLVFLSCSTTNPVSSSKYETVFCTSIDNSEYASIYRILRDNFNDFPKKRGKKVTYVKNNIDYSFRISLKNKRFKMKYSSNKGYNDQISAMKSKIENMVK
ncbi:hypothetical protein SAMN05421766_102197 [Zobellia uliginosa]|uniref:Uncharacterized protein n=1 Tax=Zobellia uliginosa TaxID=143224 RepID=A0ABY1KLN1_9FLAO|nr:hypothetical protein SAMN05421766_102197 [Zobellia uliginosa]